MFTALLKTELTPVAVAMYKKYKTKFPEELKQLCSETDKVWSNTMNAYAIANFFQAYRLGRALLNRNSLEQEEVALYFDQVKSTEVVTEFTMLE